MITFLRNNANWLAAGFLMTLSSSFGQTFVISAFAGEIRSEFGLSHSQWGTIYSVGTLASAILMLWAGATADRFRVRVLILFVLPFFAAACVAMSVNRAVWLLPIVIFALRFGGQGMMIHLSVVAMGRWFVATRGKALSVSMLGVTVGESLLPLAIVSLMGVLAWRSVWILAAIGLMALVPALLLLLRHERTPRHDIEASPSPGMGGRHWSRQEVLRHWLFWLMIPLLLGVPAFMTALFFQQVHLAEVKSIPHLALVSVFPIFTAASVTMMLTSGMAIDRFGTARLLPLVAMPSVIGFSVLGLAGSMFGIAAGMACVGLSMGANSTITNAFWAEFFGTRHLGAIKAMASAVLVFGSAVGPVLSGVLIDAGVGFEIQLLMIAGWFALSAILILIGAQRASADLPATREIDIVSS